MFSYLEIRSYFEANGPNRIHSLLKECLTLKFIAKSISVLTSKTPAETTEPKVCGGFAYSLLCCWAPVDGRETDKKREKMYIAKARSQFV